MEFVVKFVSVESGGHIYLSDVSLPEGSDHLVFNYTHELWRATKVDKLTAVRFMDRWWALGDEVTAPFTVDFVPVSEGVSRC